MITLEVGRPNELAQSLAMLNAMSVNHLRIHTKTHFWHTNDNLHSLVNEMERFKNLMFLEISGDSYPTLLDVSNFLEFLRSGTCNVKILKMPISPPFPGQYRIQDRTFMVNKVLYLIHNCRSIVRANFHCKNGEGGGDGWVHELNVKLRSILRNRDGKDGDDSTGEVKNVEGSGGGGMGRDRINERSRL